MNLECYKSRFFFMAFTRVLVALMLLAIATATEFLVFLKTYPHSCTIKMYHEPFGRIECKRVGVLYPFHPAPKLWTNESTASIRRINMQPQICEKIQYSTEASSSYNPLCFFSIQMPESIYMTWGK